MMPGMSGTQLAAELWKRKPELHVILTSGWSEGSSRFAGHLTFIPKPFTADELLRHVERALPRGTGKT
jgi:FixJ family two-component response regulator